MLSAPKPVLPEEWNIMLSLGVILFESLTRQGQASTPV